MADDDDDSIRIGQREAGSLSRDLENTILEFLEPVNLPLCYDDDSIQIGHREADSISGDLSSAVLDLLEPENALLQPLLSETSISQGDVEAVTEWDTLEDVEPDTECDTSEEVSPDPSGVMPNIITEEVAVDRDVDISENSIEKIFEESLISNSAFALEKVLGESTANILTEAEAEASKFASKLRSLDTEWNLDTEPHNILTCEICQLFVRTVDRLLDKRDRLMNHYLPLTEEEICNLKIAVEELDDGADHQRQSCLARINNLSGKLRQRAYMMTLSQLRVARRNTQESLCQLHQTIDLIGQVQQEVRPECHQSYRELSAITVEWTQRRSSVTSKDSMKKLTVHSGSEESKKHTPRSSIVEELDTPLAHSSSIEKVSMPTEEISQLEKEEEEVIDIGTPPIEIKEEALVPLPEMSSPEPALPTPKAPTPRTERIHKDVANITITAPGCDDDPELASNMLTESEGADFPPSQMEAQALQMSRSLALNLQGTYENLLANLQHLPTHLQKKLYQTCQRMAELGSDFNSAHNFGDLSRSILNKSFEVVAEAQGSLDELMEYALQSPQALLWLKDHLPVPARETEQEQALDGDSLLPIEGEADPSDMERRNILKIQQIYDPKGCEDDTLSGKEKEITPPSHPQDFEDILETQQAYDPKGCEDYIPSKVENEEVQPSSKQEWNILETLQGYIPRLSDKGDVFSDEKEEITPSANEEEEEERETDILKLQKAHDPKGCEDYIPSKVENEEVQPSSKQEWNILETLQGYIPRLSDKGDVFSDEKEEIPPSANEEEEEEERETDILKLQKAHDPKGCEDYIPSKVENEEVQPSSKQEWNILETLQGYIPRLSDKGDVSSDEKEEIPPSANEVEEERETDILKLQWAHDPKGCEDRRFSGEVAAVATSSSQTEWKDILEIQQDYDPKGCVEAPPPSKSGGAPSGQRDDWNVLGMLQAYIPKISPKETPPVEDKKETVVTPPLEKEEVLERDILETQKAHDPKGCSEEVEVQPSSRWESASILQIQAMYDPNDCKEGVPLSGGVVVPPSAKQDSEDILKILQAYDPRGCDEEPPPRKEGATPLSNQEDWNLLKMLQAYVPKTCPFEALSSKEKKPEVVPPQKQVVKERSILKNNHAVSSENHHANNTVSSENHHANNSTVSSEKKEMPPPSEIGNILKMEMYGPKDCEEGAPFQKEGEEAVHPSGKAEVEDILKIQRAYDPKGCEDEAPSWKERREAPTSGKQEEWNIMKFFQSYIPKSRSEEPSAAAAVEVKVAAAAAPQEVKPAPPSPSKREVKEVVPPAKKWEAQEWDILKIQEAYDPQGCKEEDR